MRSGKLFKTVTVREREKERDRETDRQTGRQTERKRDREGSVMCYRR